MSDAPRIEILSDGTVRANAPARERLSEVQGEYALAVDLPGLVMLRSDAADAPRVLMAGEILQRMTIMEVINVIATANWRGDFTVLGPEHRRTLAFDQGALKGATSNAPDERLGAVLFRGGVLDRAQIRELAEEVGTRRFGELCVEQGLIDQATLYNHLQRQAEDVFFAALLEAEGSYVFTVGESEVQGTPVHMPVHGLLMEGVQRIDEMALFRDKVPGPHLCPERIPDAKDPKKLSESAQKVLLAIDGNKSIEEIARETALGEFATTKAVYHLLQQKQIVLHAPSNVDPDAVRALVSSFNDVLQDIFMAVATYGGLKQTRQTLEAWIHGSGYGPYFGEGVDEFGAIDAEHVADALSGVTAEHPLEALHQALHELAAFALFSATTALPRDQELSLARDVNARLKAIRV